MIDVDFGFLLEAFCSLSLSDRVWNSCTSSSWTKSPTCAPAGRGRKSRAGYPTPACVFAPAGSTKVFGNDLVPEIRSSLYPEEIASVGESSLQCFDCQDAESSVCLQTHKCPSDKIFRRDSVYTVEHIEQPPTLFNRSRLQTFDSCIVLYDTILTAEILIFNNRDSPLFWNITVQNIATDPSSTSGSWR